MLNSIEESSRGITVFLLPLRDSGARSRVELARYVRMEPKTF